MLPGRDDLSHLHRPVLVDEVLAHLAPDGPVGGVVVDGTVGYGGHAEAMLLAWPECRVLGLDRDPEALHASRRRLGPFGSRVRLFHASYADLAEVLATAGEEAPRAILLDLGASSPQFDVGERGFSFRAPEALADMRFDPSAGGETAADLVNRLPEARLADLLFAAGGERRSRAIARALVAARPVRTVGDLLAAIGRVARRDASGLHPATRTFQALRMGVNDEAGHLARGLRAALAALAAGGRLAVLCFHGGEERAVKDAFREASAHGISSTVTKKPVRPTEDETRRNARAGPARLRVAEKRAHGPKAEA